MRVTAFIRQKDASKNDLTARASVYFRVRDVGLDIKCASELQINPNHWSQERQGYKTRVALVDDTVRLRFDEQVRELTNVISKSISSVPRVTGFRRSSSPIIIPMPTNWQTELWLKRS